MVQNHYELIFKSAGLKETTLNQFPEDVDKLHEDRLRGL